jgi:hypothetical protein
VWGTSIGLGGASSSAILTGVCYSGGLVGWWCLGWWDGVDGWVLCALGYGGYGLSGWVMGLVLIGDLGGAFVWMHMLAQSSGWHR